MQVCCPLFESAVEAIAEFRRLNFFGILVADGSERVGVNDAAFEEVEGVVMLHAVHGENVPWQQEALCGLRRKPALVSGVMNR